MSQVAHPISDLYFDSGIVTEDGITQVNMFSHIDETSPDDSDGVRATFLHSGDNIYVCGLTALIDPVASSSHVMKWNGWANQDSAQQTVELRQDYVDETTKGTLIHSSATTELADPDTPGTFNTASEQFTFTLTGAEANNITDYTTLALRFILHNGNNLVSNEVTFANFTVPDAPPTSSAVQEMFVVGEAGLTAFLAASGSTLVSVTALGGSPSMTVPYFTGYQSGSAGDPGSPPPSSSIVLPDTRTFRVVF